MLGINVDDLDLPLTRVPGMFFDAICEDMDSHGVKLDAHTREVAYKVCQEFAASFIDPPYVEYPRRKKKILATIIERLKPQDLKPGSRY
jgi:hypothetical protein